MKRVLAKIFEFRCFGTLPVTRDMTDMDMDMNLRSQASQRRFWRGIRIATKVEGFSRFRFSEPESKKIRARRDREAMIRCDYYRTRDQQATLHAGRSIIRAIRRFEIQTNIFESIKHYVAWLRLLSFSISHFF
jgi:hypothetical protein